MKLFIEDMKGYMDTYTNVYSIQIKKINNKNNLIIKYNPLKDDTIIPLNTVKLAFMINIETMEEYFRYEK